MWSVIAVLGWVWSVLANTPTPTLPFCEDMPFPTPTSAWVVHAGGSCAVQGRELPCYDEDWSESGMGMVCVCPLDYDGPGNVIPTQTPAFTPVPTNTPTPSGPRYYLLSKDLNIQVAGNTVSVDGLKCIGNDYPIAVGSYFGIQANSVSYDSGASITYDATGNGVNTWRHSYTWGTGAGNSSYREFTLCQGRMDGTYLNDCSVLSSYTGIYYETKIRHIGDGGRKGIDTIWSSQWKQNPGWYVDVKRIDVLCYGENAPTPTPMPPTPVPTNTPSCVPFEDTFDDYGAAFEYELIDEGRDCYVLFEGLNGAELSPVVLGVLPVLENVVIPGVQMCLDFRKPTLWAFGFDLMTPISALIGAIMVGAIINEIRS